MTTMLVVVVDLHGGFHFRFVECANEVAKTNLEACSFDAPVMRHAPGNLQACQLGMHTHKGHPAKGRKDIRRRKNSEVEASESGVRWDKGLQNRWEEYVRGETEFSGW